MTKLKYFFVSTACIDIELNRVVKLLSVSYLKDILWQVILTEGITRKRRNKRFLVKRFVVGELQIVQLKKKCNLLCGDLRTNKTERNNDKRSYIM